MADSMMKKVERMIARRVILDALQAGYALNVNNGGDSHELPSVSRDAEAVLAAMFATDDEHLLVYKLVHDPKYPDDRAMDSWKHIGWVYFIYGNGNDGLDVICDHSTNMEAVVAGAMALVNHFRK